MPESTTREELDKLLAAAPVPVAQKKKSCLVCEHPRLRELIDLYLDLMAAGDERAHVPLCRFYEDSMRSSVIQPTPSTHVVRDHVKRCLNRELRTGANRG